MSNNISSFEHFVYFTYKLEWDIPKEFEPQGYLAIFLPKSFPSNSQLFRIPIEKRNGYFEKTIDACVDDFFIDCAIRKSLLHIARYSNKDLKIVEEKIKKKTPTKNKNNNFNNKKSKLDKTNYQEKFTRESIFLDAGTLFIPDRKDVSITVNMEIFDYLTFSIQIDENLLSIPHIKKFAPTILHINKIDNIFNDTLKYENFDELILNPIYFECQIGANSYFLVPRYDRNQKTISIDATIVISPRKDQSIVFRIYDKIEEIPESIFIGSGLYISKYQNNEEEEDYDEEIENNNEKKLIKSISEENLLPKGSKTKEKPHKSHRHHHHSKNKDNNDDTFTQTMKKVEEMSKYHPPIQYTSPIKPFPCEHDKQKSKMTNEKPISGIKPYPKTPRHDEFQSGRKSRIMIDNQINTMCSPVSVSKLPQKQNIANERYFSTEVSPTENLNFYKDQDFGYCQFYLFPERHAVMKLVSSTNDNSYKDATISFDIYDPAARFPPPDEILEIKRPLTVHKRPLKSSRTNQKEIIYDNCKHAPSAPPKNNQSIINLVEKQQIQNSINIYFTHNNELFTNDNALIKLFPEDQKILSIEKPTIKLLRWVLSCSRFSPVSLKLTNFIQNFHKTTIHGFSHVLNPCFKNCFRKSPDLITGFHFLSPKEEVFILETRAFRPNKASLSLELFLKNEMPPETHIIANSSIAFPAPRLYCCTENLIQRVEIPISLDELLQVNGLYFHKNENHKLFPIAQKLANLIQSKKLAEITGSFPNYSEIKLLEKRASSLYATPLQKSLTITPIAHAKGADFGDSNKDDDKNNNCNIIINNNNNNLNIVNNYFVSINGQDKQSQPKQSSLKEKISDNKERLTTYYLAKPGCSSSTRQRGESVSTRFRKKSVRDEMNERSEMIEHSNMSVYIKPPDDIEKPFQKAPRSISTTKQPS